jgi:hypothetical protein
LFRIYEGKGNLGGQGYVIIIKWIKMKLVVINVNCVQIRQDSVLMVDSFGHGNEPPGFIRSGNILDQLNYCQLLKKDMFHGVTR